MCSPRQSLREENLRSKISTLVAVEPGAVAFLEYCKLKILKDSSLYVAGEVISKLFPFLMLPYLTRMLDVEEYGQLSYLMTIVVLINIFISFIQFDAISRYFFYYGKNNLAIIVKSGNLLSFSIFLMLLFYFLINEQYVYAELSIIALLQSFMQVRVTLLQFQKKVVNYIVAQLSSALISTVATFLAFYLLNASAETRMFCIGFGYVIATLYAGKFINLKPRKTTFRNVKQGVLYIISFCWPLIFHHLAYYAKGQYDRVFISNVFNDKLLAVYSAGLQIALILPVLQMAIAKGILPYYYEFIKEGKATRKFILVAAFVATFISLLPSVVAGILPNSLYSLILGDEYINSKYYCVLFLIGYGINSAYLVVSNYLFFHGRNKLVVAINVCSSLIYLIILFYIGKKSIELVPYATVISNLTLVIMSIFLYLSLYGKTNK